MYDDLIKAIRQNTCHFDACGMCPKRNALCLDRIALQAADAIEELSHDYEKLAEDFNGAVELLHKREKPRWIPVEERRAEIPCICCDANGNMPFIPKGIITIKDDQGLWQIDAGLADPSLHQSRLKPVLGYQNRITYWMPLPQPPKEE